MCWPLVPEFAGSNPAEAVGLLERKNHQHAFFGGEVKLLVPCHKLQHVKDPKMAWKSSFRLNYQTVFSPIVPPFTTRISDIVQMWRYLAAKVGMSKGGGK